MADIEMLKNEALDARKKAYCPYSGFAVGAALLTSDGKIYKGANIENSAFSPSCCAERTAFFKAIFDGQRDFCGIFIAGGKINFGEKALDACYPCGVCRQVMAEFCEEDFKIYTLKNGKIIKKTLGELLPEAFGDFR